MPNPENIKGKGFDKRPENINKKGRPPVLPEVRELIAKILSEEKNGISGAEAILRGLMIRAIKGDTAAARELLDRYYGKVKQDVDVTTDGEKIIFNIQPFKAKKNDK